jgi:Lrp/AsnC family transcriptional regulator|tara:strand:+ start:233 stop:688 length:456 start_codon:yes stop_codon:yes gene_type:complete
MDYIDKKIIFILQRQADLPLSEISKRVGLSQTPCWNRIKKLEEDGVIEKKVTLINKRKVNLPITVFLMITVRNHNSDWMKKFSEILKKYKNILEAHRITGSQADYIIKVVAESIEEYDEFQQVLIKNIEFNSMSSGISLQELKSTTILPIK